MLHYPGDSHFVVFGLRWLFDTARAIGRHAGEKIAGGLELFPTHKWKPRFALLMVGSPRTAEFLMDHGRITSNAVPTATALNRPMRRLRPAPVSISQSGTTRNMLKLSELDNTKRPMRSPLNNASRNWNRNETGIAKTTRKVRHRISTETLEGPIRLHSKENRRGINRKEESRHARLKRSVELFREYENCPGA